MTKGLPQWLSGKESACKAGDAGDMGSLPELRRSPGGGYGNPLQYSCLGNPMDRGAWWATVYTASKSHTRLKQLSTHTDLNAIYLASSKEIFSKIRKNVWPQRLYFTKNIKRKYKLFFSMGLKIFYCTEFSSSIEFFHHAHFYSHIFLLLSLLWFQKI